MKKEFVVVNKEKIYFDLSKKNVKNFNLKVNMDKQVTLSVPESTSLEEAKKFIIQKASWIKKQQDYYDTFSEVKENITFENGETVFLLGKQYLMNIEPAEANNIELKNKYLKLHIKEDFIDNKEYINKVYENWLKQFSLDSFKDIFDTYERKLKNHNVKNPEIVIRKMDKRWGSCISSENKVILNLKLVKAPVCCAEYVILHELCHFKYPKHDKNFYNFLNIYMPDWAERKKILDEEYMGII